jgi:hypothetical protein
MDELYERACKVIGRQVLELERHLEARVALSDALRELSAHLGSDGIVKVNSVLAKHGIG